MFVILEGGSVMLHGRMCKVAVFDNFQTLYVMVTSSWHSVLLLDGTTNHGMKWQRLVLPPEWRRHKAPWSEVVLVENVVQLAKRRLEAK